MTTRRLLPALVVVLLGLCLVGGATGTTTASNRRTAELDVAALLQRFVAPAGVKPLRSIPPKAGWWLKSKWVIPRSSVADRYHLWRVDARARSVVAFVRAHEPRGSKLRIDGGTARSSRYLASHHFVFQFPALPGRIWSRDLFVAIVPLSSGGTALRVDAQDAWVWTQTARDRLPGGIREIDMTRVRWAKHPALSVRVRSAAKIRRIAGWVRRLDVVPPHTGCAVEALFRLPPLTLSFRGLNGALLARLRIFGGGIGPEPACNAMAYSVRGHARDALVGTRFPTLLKRLLTRG